MKAMETLKGSARRAVFARWNRRRARWSLIAEGRSNARAAYGALRYRFLHDLPPQIVRWQRVTPKQARLYAETGYNPSKSNALDEGE